jgi:hypothetical protein
MVFNPLSTNIITELWLATLYEQSYHIYVVCSKGIETLVGRKTFIDLEAQNPNPLQSSLLGNANTSPSASAIVGNTSGTRLLEW